MNRLSGRKILIVSLALLAIWFVAALVSLNIGSVRIPVRTSLRLLIGRLYGQQHRRRSAGIRSLFGSAAAGASGISGGSGTGYRGHGFPVAAAQSAGRSLRPRRFDRRLHGHNSLFPLRRLDRICRRQQPRRLRPSACGIPGRRAHGRGRLRNCRQAHRAPARARRGCCWPASCWPLFFLRSTSFFSPAPTRPTCAEFFTG